MNAEEIAALAGRLAAFNEWRRGMDTGPQPDPRAVGQDLDAAIAALRATAMLLREEDRKRPAR